MADEKKYCTNCGAENPKDAIYCNACGHKILNLQEEDLSSSPQQDLSDDWPRDSLTDEKKSPNSHKKWILILILAALFLIIIAFFYYQHQFPSEEKLSQAYQRHNYSYVIEKGKNTLEKHPSQNLSEIYLLSCYREKKYEDAKKMYENLKLQDPQIVNSPIIHATLGNIYLLTKEESQSLKHYEQMVSAGNEKELKDNKENYLSNSYENYLNLLLQKADNGTIHEKLTKGQKVFGSNFFVKQNEQLEVKIAQAQKKEEEERLAAAYENLEKAISGQGGGNETYQNVPMTIRVKSTENHIKTFTIQNPIIQNGYFMVPASSVIRNSYGGSIGSEEPSWGTVSRTDFEGKDAMLLMGPYIEFYVIPSQNKLEYGHEPIGYVKCNTKPFLSGTEAYVDIESFCFTFRYQRAYDKEKHLLTLTFIENESTPSCSLGKATFTYYPEIESDVNDVYYTKPSSK